MNYKKVLSTALCRASLFADHHARSVPAVRQRYMPSREELVHPIIKVMLVGGKADGLLVSVADDATEVSVTPAQYGALSGQPLSYRIVSQTIDDERYFFGVFSDAHQDSDKLTRVALTRGMKKMFC